MSALEAISEGATGASLRPFLTRMGIESQQELLNAHLEFISDQKVQEDSYYASSIPLKHALSVSRDLLYSSTR